MARTFDGSWDTPFVLSIFDPEFKDGDVADTRYCVTPQDVLSAVREFVSPSADDIVKILMCCDGNGIVVDGYEFSVEREW